MNKLITLNDYLVEKGISMQDFSHMTGISYSRLATLRYKTDPKVDLDTIIKIYNATKEKFGTGLSCTKWLSLPSFWE
jgi:DNA-binding Xre family transcriptional regulator